MTKTYELPKGLKLQIFESFKNAAVLIEGGNNPVFEGWTIIDSVDLHGSEPQTPKIERLVLRHGGKVIEQQPEARVA